MVKWCMHLSAGAKREEKRRVKMGGFALAVLLFWKGQGVRGLLGVECTMAGSTRVTSHPWLCVHPTQLILVNPGRLHGEFVKWRPSLFLLVLSYGGGYLSLVQAVQRYREVQTVVHNNEQAKAHTCAEVRKAKLDTPSHPVFSLIKNISVCVHECT